MPHDPSAISAFHRFSKPRRLCATISAGSWYHVAATYDDSNQAWNLRVWSEASSSEIIYIHGFKTNNINVEDAAWVIGNSENSTTHFDGLIDQVAVFNDILGWSEINQIRQGTYRVLLEPQIVYLKSYTYNPLGKKATERGPYPEGATAEEFQVNYTQYAYDALERLWKVTDAQDNITETLYYPDGQAWRVIDAEDHNAVTNTYNADGTLASVADAKDNTTQYDYDGHVRLWKTTYADSTDEQRTYDDAGRLQQKQTRGGQKMQFAYDGLNRVKTKTVRNADETVFNTINYTYDLVGRLLETTDNTGTMANTYDIVGRLTQADYPSGKTVQYQYDPASQWKWVIYPDPNSAVFYAYDSLYRPMYVLDQELDPILALYTYDARSRRTRVDNYRNHTAVEYTYDTASRLLSLDNQTGSGQYEYAYTYDYVGDRMTMAVTDGGGTKTHVYGYDDIYQLTDVNYPPGYDYLATDTTFNYDPAGNRTTVIDGSGTMVYASNNLNQYTAVADVNYLYDDNGNLTNDGVNTYTYDPENRLLTVTKIPEPLAAACDNAALSFSTGGSAAWFAQSTEYYYDNDAAQSGAIADGQETWLETTIEGEGTLVFWWKVSSQKNKDWLEFRLDGDLQDQISGNANWQQQSYPVSGAGPHTLQWRYVKDASKTGGSDCGWLDYVQWSGSYPGGAWGTIAYTYDPAGRRIEKAVDGQTQVKYVYDGVDCIAEYDANDTLLRKYIHGPAVDEPICMIEVADANATYYYHYDGLGNIIALSDEDGNAVQLYEYSVYGRVAASDPNHTNPFLFTGRRFDADTGLYYYRARYYNPYIGRFLQTDPIGYANGINWYLYCGNNPVILVDPWGLCEEGLDFWSIFSDTSGLRSGYGRDVIDYYLNILRAPGDYYRALRAAGLGPVEAVLQAANMSLGKVVGYSTMAEGLVGIDVRSTTELSTGSRVWRTTTGGLQSLAFAVAAANTVSAATAPGVTASSGTTYEQLVSKARRAHPKKAGIAESHHITPRYLGGPAKGPTVELNAAYHQEITNAFREAYPYGQAPPDPAVLQRIMRDVYGQYPLPPGTGQ